MLALIGASGKLGGATLAALLEHNLVPKSDIVCCTSSQPGSRTWSSLEQKGVHVRHASFDDKPSMEAAFAGCQKLFLVSSPRIELDYNDAPPGTGREKHHFAAIDAARSAGVEHIYYSSLAFQNPSKAGVMRAHVRTEAYLAELSDIGYTVIREGIYNESWPRYVGSYNVKADDRTEIILGGDCPISWTAISDLGLGNALVLAAPSSDYAAKTFYLSTTRGAKTLKEIANIISETRSKDVSVKVVSRTEYERHYIQDRQMPAPAVEWWSTSYDALKDCECLICDPTLENLMRPLGKKPKPVEETIREMLNA